MTESEHDQRRPRDAAGWAKPVERLRLGELPEGATSLNIEGRRLTGPLQGFGKLWQKTYRVRLAGAEMTPQRVIKEWKENYAVFWPPGNRFYAPLTGIAPGEVGHISGGKGPTRLSTGVMVIYADDESFTFMTPEGHPFAGFITFSAHRDETDATVAQVHLLVRPSDPIFEVAFLAFLSREEDKIWQHTLSSLAAYFDVEGEVETNVECVDRQRQWSEARNIWHNAGARTMAYAAGAPFRWMARPFRRP